LCLQIAGVMAVTTAITSYRNTHAHTYHLLVIGSMESDVITLCCVSLAVIGLFNIGVGIFKALHRYSMSFNQVRELSRGCFRSTVSGLKSNSTVCHAMAS
jgi:hypothetical protein